LLNGQLVANRRVSAYLSFRRSACYDYRYSESRSSDGDGSQDDACDPETCSSDSGGGQDGTDSGAGRSDNLDGPHGR
jgi:hypothetical protein